jgi:hypothetical protein
LRTLEEEEALEYFNNLMDYGSYAGVDGAPDYLPTDLYVVMDSEATLDDVSTLCKEIYPEGTLTCDYDNDGTIDILGSGDKSWLDLSGGGGGASDLTDWINNGYPGEVSWHFWLPGQSGTTASVFMTAADNVGRVYVIPVYNAFCDNDVPDPELNPDCINKAHDGNLDLLYADYVVEESGSVIYFHIQGFARFMMTCVDPNMQGCPGHDMVAELVDVPAGALKTIEGFFISGVSSDVGGKPGAGGGGLDTGTWAVYLIPPP